MQSIWKAFSTILRKLWLRFKLNRFSKDFAEQLAENQRTLDKVLADKGAEDLRPFFDPFGGVAVNEMNEEQLSRYIQLTVRSAAERQAREEGVDAEVIEARRSEWLMAEHFDIDIDIAHKVALAHVRGEIETEEQAEALIAKLQTA